MKQIFFLNFIIILILNILLNCKSTDKNKINIHGTPDPRKIKISEDIDKDKLKSHMKSLFAFIESTISKADFETWYNTTSNKYKLYLNNKNELQKITYLSDYLKNRKILLKSPKDYFEYVVIPSREGNKLEFIDCEMVNKNHVKVFCLFDKKDKLIYDFIFEDNLWKIDR